MLDCSLADATKGAPGPPPEARWKRSRVATCCRLLFGYVSPRRRVATATPYAGSAMSVGSWVNVVTGVVVTEPVAASSRTAGTGSSVGEQLAVAVVGVPARGVGDPPRRFEGDAVGIGEVDRPHHAVIDDVGDLAAVSLQPLAQRLQGVLVGQVERQVVELRGSWVGHPGGLGEAVDLGVVVLEEGDRVAADRSRRSSGGTPECRSWRRAGHRAHRGRSGWWRPCRSSPGRGG